MFAAIKFQHAQIIEFHFSPGNLDLRARSELNGFARRRGSRRKAR
jgi:hypothetical protein